MIQNAKQLEITKYWLGEFKASIRQLEQDPDIAEPFREMCIRSQQSIIDEFEVDIHIYEKNNSQ
jgi:hypothetical protein